MNTAFDDLVATIKQEGYHNHRNQKHSDIVSRGILRDLLNTCEPLKADLESGDVHYWLNVKTRGGRGRRIDLLIAEPLLSNSSRGQRSHGQPQPKPDIRKARVCIEHKSVITAHRNKGNRYDDLEDLLGTIHSVQAEAVLVGTVIVGIAGRVLNVPDEVKKRYKTKMAEFENKVRPRLSKGDQTLWGEFDWAVSENEAADAQKTIERFRELPTRQPGHTHVEGFDALLLVPMYIDNVNPPYIPRPNELGIDFDHDYQAMLETICKAYRMRWHA